MIAPSWKSVDRVNPQLSGLCSATLSVTVLLAILLSGCDESSQHDSSRDESIAPVTGGRITIAVNSDPGTLNPATRTGALAGSILGVLNDGLADMSDDLQFHPNLAHHWTWTEDGLELTYHLRPGLRWSDGEPLTAHDVEVSHRIYSNEDVPNPRRSNMRDIETVTAIDDTTVTFQFRTRSPEMIFNSAFTILPAHVVENLDPTTIREWPINREPVSSGAYRLKNWVPNERVVLERNPYYHGEPPYLNEVVFKVVPEESVRMLQLAIGEVDLVSEIPPKNAERLEKSPDTRVYELGPRYLGYMVYNLENPSLQDAAVRNAISYAIDRRSLIDGLMFGHGEAVASPIAPLIAWAYDDKLIPHHRNLDRSRQLLANAGWVDNDGDGIVEKDGQPLSVLIKTRTGDPVRENGVLVVQSNLRDVGIDARPRMLELSTVLQQVSRGDFDIYLGQVSARLSPDLTASFSTGGGFNYGHYSNARVDSLIAAGRLQLDRGQAAVTWREVQQILYNEQPMSMLYAKYPLVAIRSEIRDATPSFLSVYENIDRWWRASPTR
jgi:peptide/nickel transport system substrate-binding protein